jgi:hypothetical protein
MVCSLPVGYSCTVHDIMHVSCCCVTAVCIQWQVGFGKSAYSHDAGMGLNMPIAEA